MQLASYLADNRGIIMELAFTRDDGGLFPEDVMAIIHDDTFNILQSRFPSPSVGVNNEDDHGLRLPLSQNVLSADGRTLRNFIIVHYDIDRINSVPLDIRVNRLIYDQRQRQETLYLDLYEAFRNSDAATSTSIISQSERYDLFNSVAQPPIQTDFGVTLYGIIFARVEQDNFLRVAPGANVDYYDIPGLSFDAYNHVIGFRYRNRHEANNVEYNAFLTYLNNDNPLYPQVIPNHNSGYRPEDGISYRFFRVPNFEILRELDGINFLLASHNFIEGDWHIETTFDANRESTIVTTELALETSNPGVKLVLTEVDISLLSTTLSYELRDVNGNAITDNHYINEYFWGRLTRPYPEEVILRYDNGMAINLNESRLIGSRGMRMDSDVPLLHSRFMISFSAETYALMNTGRLEAIIINGEVFPVS